MTTFNVEGPTLIQYSATTGDESSATFTDLGYTDNADLVNFEIETFEHPIKTTRLGEVPEEFIHLGAVAHLNITLLKWNKVNGEKLQHQHGTEQGDLGTIGGMKLTAGGGTDAFAIKIVGGVTTYTFHNCVLTGRGVRVLDLGNRPKRLALSILCLPENMDGTTISTDNIYTVSDT